MEKNKETNYRLWLANTIKANLDHCSRLAAVCGSGLDAGSVASYLTDIAEGHCPLTQKLRAGGT